MARRRRKNSFNGMITFAFLLLGFIVTVIRAVTKIIFDNGELIIMLVFVVGIVIIIAVVVNSIIEKQRRELLSEILSSLQLEMIGSQLHEYDDRVIVKSRQALNNYSDVKYFKDNDIFESVREKIEFRRQMKDCLNLFVKGNVYQNRPQYGYVRNQLISYIQKLDSYRVLVIYITSAGNNRGERTIYINEERVNELIAHPEYLMTKGEYNKFLKQQAKELLEEKKHFWYNHVNSIIDFANKSRDELIVKKHVKELDELVQKLFDKTVNNIQKVSKIDSDEWGMLDNFITSIDEQIKEIVQKDKRISEYYESESFSKIRETCNLLTQSQKEFNDYINEKAQSITKLFGTRIVRNETQNEDVYNYFRAYKKSVTPFTAEVSSTVFGSAENNPIGYIVKYFYPNKSKYKEQIEKLRMLIEELETLREAKIIIDNYKENYNQYIQNVPKYILDDDEAGFYSRLGLTIIDENVLNVEYKFVYTSDGGMAQRSFTVPMNEENITELINHLESKLSLEALAKEQRTLMTTKLRTHIKERDNYTCCQCGNSVYAEPNLLLEIDHIIPIAKGGLTQENNLQTLCWKCNRNKGAKLLS